MNSSTYRRPGAFSPRRPSSPGNSQGPLRSNDPSESDSSSSSQVTTVSADKGPANQPQSQFPRPSVYPVSNPNSSSTSVNNFSRPSFSHTASEQSSRKASPLLGGDIQRHKRQHSQGFFEPSLPSASSSEQAAMAKLTASQIAAQAAMQHQFSSQHARKRSQTVPSPQSPSEAPTGRRRPTPIQTRPETERRTSGPATPVQQYHNGLVGGHAAAATAANVAFPRTTQLSPGLTSFEGATEKEYKVKTEKSKMKLFSKPKQSGLSSNKDYDHRDKPLPSPNKMGPSGPSALSKIINPSMTSLADSTTSVATSMYSATNTSTSTLVPTDRQTTYEKEKAHRHHFLSRQKNKLKEKMDEHALPLSSASSNSKPLDPSAPQSLYSFAPASPGPSTTSFTKSVSGLDLRHGGRALREKKKEEKALAFPDSKRVDTDRNDWMPSTTLSTSASHNYLGPPAASSTLVFGGVLNALPVDAPGQSGLQGFGLNNMSPEDAWDFLKAKLLIIFEGEELRMPVEDLNRLVSVHIQRCILKRLPTIITEDLRELLKTGFLSLDQTLKGVPDHHLIPRLVDMWLFVFGTVLPYMQAVFLPLDLEFKGHGPLLSVHEAAEFWGANPDSTDNAFGNEFDVRRIVLISYRDNVILPHHDSLKATFSRLSLDSINAGVSLGNNSPNGASNGRPGTAASLDPALASFNSQGSTLLGETAGSRSRATSNLSAPELPPIGSPSLRRQAQPDSSHVTETVGRMLQCISVLASVQSGDGPQVKMEGLAKELKLNWLGRGRTGRNRKGFVGTRVRPPNGQGSSQGQTERVDESRRASML